MILMVYFQTKCSYFAAVNLAPNLSLQRRQAKSRLYVGNGQH